MLGRAEGGVTEAPLLIGHRGAPRLARENTLAAFRAALAAGLHGIETDVQRTGDGALVLHHDAVLADGSLIASLALADVRRAAPDVPVLTDLLGVLLDCPAARLNLEVKTAAPTDDSRAADLCAALAAWPAAAASRVWLSSFDPLLLLALEEGLRAAALAVPLAFLVHTTTALRLLPALNVCAVHPHHSLVTPARVHEWHGRGLKVFTWTVNDLGLARSLLAAGVDGLIGDEPDLLARAVWGR